MGIDIDLDRIKAGLEREFPGKLFEVFAKIPTADDPFSGQVATVWFVDERRYGAKVVFNERILLTPGYNISIALGLQSIVKEVIEKDLFITNRTLWLDEDHTRRI